MPTNIVNSIPEALDARSVSRSSIWEQRHIAEEDTQIVVAGLLKKQLQISEGSEIRFLRC
jgi:hypothetical protein